MSETNETGIYIFSAIQTDKRIRRKTCTRIFTGFHDALHLVFIQSRNHWPHHDPHPYAYTA